MTRSFQHHNPLYPTSYPSNAFTGFTYKGDVNVNTKILKVLALSAVLVPMIGIGGGAQWVSFGASAAQADVTVYRGLQRKNATYAKVNDNQFRIDDDGLSTFEAAEFAGNATTRQCKLALTIEGVVSKPNEGTTQGDITGMAGYQGTYTPEYGGDGHWSIAKTGGGTTAGDFTTYALADGHISVNAGYTGGSASLCDTPDNAN